MRKRGVAVHWTVSQKFIVIDIRNIKLKIKFHLYLSDSCHQKVKRYVTWGLKLQKFYVYFLCNPMEPFISGVRPYDWSNISLATIVNSEWLVRSALCVIDSSHQTNPTSCVVFFVKRNFCLDYIASQRSPCSRLNDFKHFNKLKCKLKCKLPFEHTSLRKVEGTYST